MKTVLCEKVDGLEIIVGFDKPTIDPVGTTEAVYNAVSVEIETANSALEDSRNIVANFAKRESPTNPNISQAFKGAIEVYEKDMGVLRELLRITPEKFKAHTVYFEPKPGEEILKDKEAKKLITAFRALEKDERLLRNGRIISCLVGVKYWHKENGKWKENVVRKIGDEIPGGAITEPTPTEQQEIILDLDRQRIQSLSTKEKEFEKNQQLDQALNAAAIQKSKLEITGDPDPLGKSKAQYEKLKEKIEARYI